jgi:hypothetical protein
MIAQHHNSQDVWGLDQNVPSLLHKYRENDSNAQAMKKSRIFTANKYDDRNEKQHFSEHDTLLDDDGGIY